jgi:hypothetical protein
MDDFVNIDGLYSCSAKNLVTSVFDSYVIEVTGEHETGKTNDDVK